MSDANTQEDVQTLHQDLINDLVERKVIQSDDIEAAFRAIPRHLFLPDTPITAVYQRPPVITKRENGLPTSSSSQPAMMAIMLEQLAVRDGENVLEVGAGTGYNAALLGQLVGKNGRVTSIDIDPDIVAAAQSHLQNAGADNVQVVCGDGTMGFAENAPYDCLMLTVGGWDISPEWLAQLKPNGRIILPLSLNGPQLSVVFTRKNDQLVSSSIRPCGFMRLQGPHAELEFSHALESDGDIFISRFGEDFSSEHFKAATVQAWLATDTVQLNTAVDITMQDIFRSIVLWLTLNEPHIVFLEDRDVQQTTPVPFLYSMEILESKTRWMYSIGLCLADGMAFLMRPPTHQPFPKEQPEGKPQPFPLYICGFGSRDTAVQRLYQHILQWDQAERPQTTSLKITAVPIANIHFQSDKNSFLIKKKWHQFIVQW